MNSEILGRCGMPEAYAPAAVFSEEVLARPLNWWIHDSLWIPFVGTPITKRRQFRIGKESFEKWMVASMGRITFKAHLTKYPAIIVKFASTNHGDPYPFDGPGGVLAHAYLPDVTSLDYSGLVGDMHFDEDETWSDKLLELVWIHEAGHALGLPHSSDQANIMYPYINMNHSGQLADTEINLLNQTYGW